MRGKSWFLLICACLILACGGEGGGPSGSTGTITGTVTSAATGVVLSGATVSVGSAQATSGADGRFELTGVSTGAVTISCARVGFSAYSAAITVQEGSNAQDIVLAAEEVHLLGDFALYVPASAVRVRAVVVALGGPDTRAFVDGRGAGGTNPAVEVALQAMGAQLRTLARDSGFALLGTGTVFPNEITNDAVILGALQDLADITARAELSSAPFIMLGISGGGPEAFGLAQRQAARTAAFALLVPQTISTFLSPATQLVPGYLSLAETDVVVNNAHTTQVFLDNRAAGAIWGLAVEPGQGHADLSDLRRTVVLNWVAVAAGLRLPAAQGGALRSVEESSGWLGNRTTFDIAPIASYSGDPLLASWLPTAGTAEDWLALVTP